METIAEAVTRLSNKVDMLIDSLPQRYVPRTDYDPWRSSVESRMKSIEDNHAALKESLTRRQEEGTRWAIQTLKEIDVKIDTRHQSVLDKLDETQRTAREQKLSKSSLFISVLFGGIATFIAISNYLTIHWHP